jgi:hypothetical protein
MKPLIARLDMLANRTRILHMSTGAARRRPMRWLPIVALTLGIIGIGIVLFANIGLGIGLGQLPIVIGTALSGWLPIAGPVKPLATLERMDEREQQVRADAYLKTLPIILVTAIVLVSLLPWRVHVKLQSADDFDTLVALISMSTNAAMFLLIVWNSVPTLYASLKWPHDDEGED